MIRVTVTDGDGEVFEAVTIACEGRATEIRTAHEVIRAIEEIYEVEDYQFHTSGGSDIPL